MLHFETKGIADTASCSPNSQAEWLKQFLLLTWLAAVHAQSCYPAPPAYSKAVSCSFGKKTGLSTAQCVAELTQAGKHKRTL